MRRRAGQGRARRSPSPGSARGYKGEIAGLPDVEVNFVSSSEIAQLLKSGAAHLGITGEDLMRETIADCDERVAFLRAAAASAAPTWWWPCRPAGSTCGAWPTWRRWRSSFRRVHGRRVRVATKYMNLTRRFFAQKGVTGYRIVESLGATEGAPAAGLAELIVDITTTGATLRANGLKVLDDGVILKSQANLVSSKAAPWSPDLRRLEARGGGAAGGLTSMRCRPARPRQSTMG